MLPLCTTSTRALVWLVNQGSEDLHSNLLAHCCFSAFLLFFGSLPLALAAEKWGKCVKWVLEA